MTRKKQRNTWAKNITHRLPFVVRHRIAKKISQYYEYYTFSHTTIRDLEQFGFQIIRKENNLILEGISFNIIYSDELIIDLTQ